MCPEGIDKENFSLTKDLHTMICCLQPFILENINDKIKQSLELTNSQISLPSERAKRYASIITNNIESEIDTFSLYQKTAKMLFRKLADILRGIMPTGQFKYLKDAVGINRNPKQYIHLYKSIPSLLDIIKVSLIHQIIYTGSKLKKRMGEVSLSAKWDKIFQNDVILTSKLHAAYTIGSIFYEQVLSLSLSKGLKNSLLRLCKVYLCSTILKYCSNVILHANLHSQTLINIRIWHDKLISRVKNQIPNLIAFAEPLYKLSNDNFARTLDKNLKKKRGLIITEEHSK